jgi:hypothetical protein
MKDTLAYNNQIYEFQYRALDENKRIDRVLLQAVFRKEMKCGGGIEAITTRINNNKKLNIEVYESSCE